MPVISREEALQCLAWWEMMRQFEAQEIRHTSMADKLQQLDSLMASRQLFATDLKADLAVLEVRERWMRLRQVLSD